MCFATSSSHSSSCITPTFSLSLPLPLTASSCSTASTSRAVSPALHRRPFAIAAALRAPPCRVRISHSSSSHPPSQSTTTSSSSSSSTSALASLGLPAAAAAALAAQVRALDARIGYLGPVSRHKVLTAVELAEKHARNPQQMAANAAVAAIVADLKMDCETVCAALLRHVHISKPDVEIELETCVGTDVLRVLKIYLGIQERIELAQDELFNETSYANLRELVLVGAQNEHRAISLKLASAVVDTRALDVVADENRRNLLAKRALYLYAPLANQLGIWFIQSELEMLAFMNLQWERYVETKRVVGERMRACQGSLDDAKKLLERLLNTTPSVKARVRSARVMGRVKGIYSVYRKMERSGKNVAEIYDLLALRVIIQPKRTDDQSELDACYAVAAAIQENYETMETRAKDYLATPKPNGYRSLHLTVHAPAKQQAATHPIEIQIRTEKMHHVAEFGAAAHWIYKEREEDTSFASTNNNASATAHDEEGNGHGGGSAKQAAVVATLAVRDPSCMQRKFGYARPRVSVPVDLTAPVSSRTGATVTLAPRGVRPRPLLTRFGGDEVLDAKRRGYVASLAAAIRASRVIVSSCGQLYQLTLGSTLYDFMSCLGVASLGAIAMVNGNVAPLSQRLEMNDIVCFISSVGEL